MSGRPPRAGVFVFATFVRSPRRFVDHRLTLARTAPRLHRMPTTTVFLAAFATLAAAPAAIAHARVVVAATQGRMPSAWVAIRTDRSRAPGRR
jgi:hypothetical protein